MTGKTLEKILIEKLLVKSLSEAKRVIAQGGVFVDEVKVGHFNWVVPKGTHTIRVGKRREAQVIV